MAELPKLPKERRGFFCTKCHSSECQEETIDQKHPPCAKCGYLGFADNQGHSDEAMLQFQRDTVEACAKVCDEYSRDKWALYKGRAPYTGTENGRVDPHTQGESDGASNCADAIRSMK